MLASRALRNFHGPSCHPLLRGACRLDDQSLDVSGRRCRDRDDPSATDCARAPHSADGSVEHLKLALPI